MNNYYNPVTIAFGVDKLKEIDTFIGNRKAIIITSKGTVKRGVISTIQGVTNKVIAVIDTVTATPNFNDLKKLYNTVWKYNFDIIIAIGGGSVIDSAKVISLYNTSKNWSFVENKIRKPDNTKEYSLIPIIAVPTTSGTSSELTPWATVWDMEIKKKYSMHLPDLWCETALCDPTLTVSMPKNITIQTALDALSHSLESIWNKNANAISTKHAIKSAKIIIQVLPKLIEDLTNIKYREQMMQGSLDAGLAFSNTKTAIAHAISYYLTAEKGIPHGIACSFCLPQITESAFGINSNIDNALRSIFGELHNNRMVTLFNGLGISTNIKDYGMDDSDIIDLQKGLKDNERLANSLVTIEDILENLSA